MNKISFYGGESCGSIGSKINTTRQECAGSIGAKEQEPELKLQTLDRDTVCFRGDENESPVPPKKKHSALGILFSIAAAAAVVVGGLGLAHKYKVADKFNHEGFKKFSNKVTEPCYNVCASTKKYAVKGYEKVKNFFSSGKGDK